jgi:hypothetical protein
LNELLDEPSLLPFTLFWVLVLNRVNEQLRGRLQLLIFGGALFFAGRDAISAIFEWACMCNIQMQQSSGQNNDEQSGMTHAQAGNMAIKYPNYLTAFFKAEMMKRLLSLTATAPRAE